MGESVGVGVWVSVGGAVCVCVGIYVRRWVGVGGSVCCVGV